MIKYIKKAASWTAMGLGGAVMFIAALLAVLFVMFVGARGICVIIDCDNYGVQTSLWGCDDNVYYTEGGWGDFTDYGEYYFNEKSIKNLKTINIIPL
ncbi:MAG: hypothetical protein LUF26_00875 [Firmicutes bacterium]|nr:hypothetical protein [Bacillota bacterium]